MEFKLAAVSPKKSFQMQCKPILLFQIIASDLRSGQYKMHTADYRPSADQVENTDYEFETLC